jgi:hypothetical protein
MKEIPFAIERLERDGEIIVLQAWAIAPREWPRPYQLTIRGKCSDASATPWDFVLEPNRDRPDVVRTLGLDNSALRCGFFFYGKLPAGMPESLCLTSSAGTHLLLSLKSPMSETSDTPRGNRWGGWRYLVKRAWALASGGQWRTLREKAGKHLRLAGATGFVFRKHAHQTLSAAAPTSPTVDCLIIDHDLGGGANQYRQQWMAQRLAQGQTIALLTFSLLGLRYVLQYFDPARGMDKPTLLATLRWQNVLQAIETLQARQIFYNNAVSFPDAQRLALGISTYKKTHASCLLTLAVHDFFMLCPSQHLMNAAGQFCHVPKDLRLCADCLSVTQQDLTALYRHTDLTLWRGSWASLLNAADEILAFDPAIPKILRDTFTSIAEDKIILRPHFVPPLREEERARIQQWQLQKPHKSGHIGIVGNISSDYKGKKTVHALAQQISDAGLPYKIICIGQTTPKPTARGIYKETGPYRKENLTDLVIENDIDVFLFCSNGPETFSYVLHEIEAYGLPIAAYPIGAQATFLQRYPYAITLPPDCSAEELLVRLAPYLDTSTPANQLFQ